MPEGHQPQPDLPPAPRYRLWLHILAIALVLATFGLVAIGGTVTSYDAGMAVPDGFTTFGYWSLTAPLEVWWHDFGTRLEHSHRLKGYVVGWLTIGLLVGVLVTQRGRGWLKLLSVGLLVFVIAQGIMGILRVDQVSTVLAAIHGVTGQLFLCLTVLAAAAVGSVWIRRARSGAKIGRVPVTAWVLLGLLLMQLILGSAVRHSNAGLAIPDWPLHYGHVIPPMDQQTLMIDFGNHHVAEGTVGQGQVMPTVQQVHLHFAHRLGAYVVLAFGIAFIVYQWRRHAGQGVVVRALALFALLLAVQVLLGVYTVLSGVHPTLATLHQTVGAALIAQGTLVAVRLKLFPAMEREPRAAAESTGSNAALPRGGVTA